jgi:hypothetical protein
MHPTFSVLASVPTSYEYVLFLEALGDRKAVSYPDTVSTS